jgi:orotate phosphoribosyltransferase
VLIIDDVISAGTSVRESVDIIKAADATPAGVVIALDRQERGQGETSAIQEVERDYGLSVASIVGLQQLIEYLAEHAEQRSALEAIRAYQSQYGI